MNNNDKTESTPNNIVELLPVDNEELVTVTGGRSYGWGGGGWSTDGGGGSGFRQWSEGQPG